MPRKAVLEDDNGRGSCCSLEAVKQFLQRDTIPEGYSKNDKRALRRRAKSFVLIGEELYFTGGRSRHNRGFTEKETDGAENPENEPDHTQVLRKVVFSEEEQQEIINNAHVGEDGSHHGMEKTTEQVSNHYYWMRIIHCVRTTIRNCPSCDSRMKIPSHLPPVPGHESTTSSVTVNIGAASTSVLEEEIVGGSGQASDDIDVSMGDDGFSVLSVPDSHSVKQEVEAGPTDVFTQIAVMKEVCSHFWQKVEIQIFGPYQAGKKQVYVAVALDSYSQFPEAVTMEVLSSATLTNFFLNLFCRYGTVEKLLLLQNQVTKNQDLYINLQDLLQAGISPSLLFPHVNPLDERWNHIEKSLVRFISLYPDLWFHCLEAFMVPLRIALPPEAIYSPYYLVHGREAPVPEKLSQVCNVSNSGHTEVQLTEDQEKQTVDMVTAAYGIHSDNPSFPVTFPEPSDVMVSTQVLCKKEHTLTDSVAEVENQQQPEEQPQGSKDTGSRSLQKRKHGRPKLRQRAREKEVEIVDEKEETREVQAKMEVMDSTECLDDVGIDAEDDSDKDSTYEPEIKSIMKKSPTAQPSRTSGRQRKATYKAQASEIFIKKSTKPVSKSSPTMSSEKKVPPSAEAKASDVCQKQITKSSKKGVKMKKCRTVEDASDSVLPKKRRGRPCKNVNRGSVETSDCAKVKCGNKKAVAEVRSGIMKSMQQLPLDTFYFIIKQFLEHSVFPPGVSEDTKQSIRQLCTMFNLKEGQLYSSAGKSAGRLIITAEKTRFSLLRKAHARGEMHHGRANVLKYLSDLNVFWNGMSLDLDAFIHCCPECIHHNPLGSQPVVHIPSKSPSLAEGGRKEDEPHMSEDEEEESSYEDLIQYLTDTTFPPTTTPRQQQAIQERSRSFRILQGSLYYQTPRMTQPRQVLFSHSLKRSALHEAHIEDGHHLSQQDTQARLRRRYFWSGLTCDVVQHVMACCMKDAMATPPVLHRNPVIQERVDRLRSYYTEEKIPKLDTSALTAAEVKGSNSDTSLAKADPSSSMAGFIPDHAVIKTLKNVIDGIDKQLSGKNKMTEKKNGRDGDQTKESSTHSSRIQKANKCQYCGKYIGGMVAYKIHLYKHTGVKPFICSTCGKAFTTNRSLLIHTRKHTGIKPYLCNQCGRGFFRSASLLYHLRAHAVGRGTPVSCDVCHRSFSTHNRLTRHKEFKHPAQAKVYICNQCGKHFTAARSLKRHEQIHTGHRKYQCHYCSKSFLRKEYLNAHLTNHTEYEQEKVKLKQCEKPSKKSQPRSAESSMYWTPNSQSTHHLEAASTSNAEGYPSHTIASHTVASQPSLPTSIVTTTHVSHLPPNSIMAHSQIHPLHHPISQASRLINVAGRSHGPLPLTVSSARPPGDVVHGGSGGEILLQPEQFSVECLSGEGTNLSEADLSAIHMLAQANITGPNLHTM